MPTFNESYFEKKARTLQPSSWTLIKAIKKDEKKNEKTEIYYLICDKIIEENDISFYQVEIVPLFKNVLRPNTPPSFSELNKSEVYTDNKFQMAIKKLEKSCRIGPYNSLILSENIRGIGIGTYAFGHLIDILKNAGYNDYETCEEKLVSSDAKRDNGINGPRRDKFYENLGFTINVDANGDGKILPEKIGNLWNDNSVKLKNKEKIEEITSDLESFIRKAINDKLKDEAEIDRLKKANENLHDTINEKRRGEIPFYKFINKTTFIAGLALGIILCYTLIEFGILK
jgi:GNAT superfamily N-acetyltransferase